MENNLTQSAIGVFERWTPILAGAIFAEKIKGLQVISLQPI